MLLLHENHRGGIPSCGIHGRIVRVSVDHVQHSPLPDPYPPIRWAISHLPSSLDKQNLRFPWPVSNILGLARVWEDFAGMEGDTRL